MTPAPSEPHAPPPRTCPECGWTEGTPVPRPLGPVARAVPYCVIVAALAAIVLWLGSTAHRYNLGMGSNAPVVLEPAFTRADLERIAAGDAADPARPGEAVLTRALLAAAADRTPEHPGSRAVDVGFARAGGQRTDISTFGWPTAWVMRLRQPNYADAVRREGFIAASTDESLAALPKHEIPRDPLRLPPRPRWRWQGGVLQHQPPPEETGGVSTITRIDVFSPVLIAGAMILAWALNGPVVWIVNRLRPKDRRSRARRFRAAVAAAAGVAMIAAGLLGAETKAAPVQVFARMRQSALPPAPVYTVREDYARLPWSRAELEFLAADPGADARVAAAILSLRLPREAAGGDGGPMYLAAACDCETTYRLGACSMTSYNRLLPLVRVARLFYVRRPDFGTREIVSPPAGLQWHRRYGQLGVHFSSGDVARPVYSVTVEPILLAAVVVVLWLIFWTARLITFIHGRATRAKRLRHGRCAACAYPLPLAARPVAP